MQKVCGIILKVSYPAMGDTSEIRILGRSMLEWVRLSLRDSFVAAVDFADNMPLPQLVKPYLNDSEFTVVLFSDAPLITTKTIMDAVFELESSRENSLRMTRGCVFRTAYLKSEGKIHGGSHRFFDEEDFITAFSFKQVAMIGEVLKSRILYYHMSQGVHIVDPASTHIGGYVVIGRGCVIYPNNTISGRTIIKDNVKILNDNIIEDTEIGDGCTIEKSVIRESLVGKNVQIGPFAHLRPRSKIGNNCRIGNFVEIKDSTLGDGTKAAHLSYIGDAEIGENCNIGCGTVFCNYDGKHKHRSRLGNGVFVGSNANLVAPIIVGDKAFIAAGSTVTEDIPPNALAIARPKQVNKENWKKKP